MKNPAIKKTKPLFLNRELSLLKFNRRVLLQSKDKRIPLLERVKFLEIFYSNMDEFFMKRVGSLKRYGLSPYAPLLIDATTASYQLKLIRKKVLELNQEAFEIYHKELCPHLLKEGFQFLNYKQLSKKHKEQADQFFKNKMFPILTPMAVDSIHPFPLISSLSLSLAVKLFDKKGKAPLFARIKVPDIFSGWICLSSELSEQKLFLSSIDLIKKHLQSLFPEVKIRGMMPFRIIRNIEIGSDLEEEDAEDLLEFIEEEIRKRKFAEIVRLEHGPQPELWLLQFLKQELNLSQEDVYEHPAPLNSLFLNPISCVSKPNLKYPPLKIWTAPQWEQDNVFDLIQKEDQLVHHPFESFSATVENFIFQAVLDPQVLAIKMTLYRTNRNSSIVKALIKAAREGKQVVCVLELKARLEEEKNIRWAQQMEKVGVHVIYGVSGLKTHSKLALIVRKEKETFQTYLHLSTGNYHSETAKLYTDLSLFTAHRGVGQDAIELFHFLTGHSRKKSYKHLIISPVEMEEKFLKLIKKEMEFAKKGRPAEIFVKVNNLEAPSLIKALYRASQAGVKIKLIVRGICCLKPGVKGLSENIEVKSLLGRFLEHSRIFFFRAGQEDVTKSLFFIGSADWMKRNLYSRVELVSPVYNKKAMKELWNLLNFLWEDKSSSWSLKSDGSYVRPPKESQKSFHERLLENFKKKIKTNPGSDIPSPERK